MSAKVQDCSEGLGMLERSFTVAAMWICYDNLENLWRLIVWFVATIVGKVASYGNFCQMTSLFCGLMHLPQAGFSEVTGSSWPRLARKPISGSLAILFPFLRFHSASQGARSETLASRCWSLKASIFLSACPWRL